jgi:hypothetical protein
MIKMPVLRGVLPISGANVSRDILAGVTLAALGIPEVMGYTKIAGTPVITGLYTILLPLVVDALLGGSRHLVVAAEFGDRRHSCRVAGRRRGVGQARRVSWANAPAPGASAPCEALGRARPALGGTSTPWRRPRPSCALVFGVASGAGRSS